MSDTLDSVGADVTTPAVEQTSTSGGLVQLGSADAVVCEGDLCWVPDSAPN